MTHLPPSYGLGTHAIHHGEGTEALNAHVQPIYMTSTFGFPDADTGTAIMTGGQPGYSYTRSHNPTLDHLARKYAWLEGIGLVRADPERGVESLVRAVVFGSGMAAISSAVLARVRAGETVLAQRSLYNTTYNLFTDTLPRYGINIEWVDDLSAAGWEAAISAHPKAALAYIETPANPSMIVVDIALVAEVAHRYGLWVMADNTYASPYCQRPLELGADIVAHSATKYLSGHGTHLMGAVASTQVDFVENEVMRVLKTHGGAASPMDAWLANLGLKTLGLRMERHCANAMAVARYLAGHPKVAEVRYPGLESDPGHAIARKQMVGGFGGMLGFELKGGVPAAKSLLPRIRLASIAASLGTVDSLVQLPAAMNYHVASPEVRARMKIPDSLIRFSVGTEDTADLLDDLEQALSHV